MQNYNVFGYAMVKAGEAQVTLGYGEENNAWRDELKADAAGLGVEGVGMAVMAGDQVKKKTLKKTLPHKLTGMALVMFKISADSADVSMAKIEFGEDEIVSHPDVAGMLQDVLQWVRVTNFS